MDFRTRRILFGTFFFMLYEFFALKYLLGLFTHVSDFYIISLVIIIESMRLIPTFTEKKKSTKLGRLSSTIYGVIEWLFMMLFFYLIIMYGITPFVADTKPFYIIGLAVLVLIGAYAYIHAHRIIVKEKVLEFDNINREYKIIHLSDVHFGSIRHEEIINDIASNILNVEDACDMVIISGDLADGSCIVEEDDFMAFDKINIPIIFTSGNHDYYPGLDSVHTASRKAGVIILENDAYEFEDLNIYGLSYSFGSIPMPSRDELKDAVKADKINIVNYHVPNGWDKLSSLGFDLQLSGHTHGGQFYPVILFGKLLFEGHNMGLFKKLLNNKNHYLHVTTGVGSMDVPMRWGTDSEMVILKLVKTK